MKEKTTMTKTMTDRIDLDLVDQNLNTTPQRERNSDEQKVHSHEVASTEGVNNFV